MSQMVEDSFMEMGLKINIYKSLVLVLQNGCTNINEIYSIGENVKSNDLVVTSEADYCVIKM